MRRALWAPGTVLVLAAIAIPAAAPTTAAPADYPARDALYHSYPEMVSHIKAVAAAHPDIVRAFSIGRSYQGRRIWAVEVSDNVGVDEGEPEVLFDGLHHAREHLSAEMAIYIVDLLADNYRKSGTLGKQATRLVNKRRTWIIPMVNPDGLQYDLTGSPYRSWRKNRQPTPGSKRIGTDLNRNYGYRFGCCGGSSSSPGAWNYRGPSAWSAPEVRAVRDFVNGRVVDGRQRIRTHISFHTAGELVLWPYGFTRTRLPRDMTRADLRVFRAMAADMAASNRYTAKQSSYLYPTDGDMIDWMYARHRIFSFTFELYPRGGTPRQHYPPDELIWRETRRNRDAVLYLMGKALCPYTTLGAVMVESNCGPFFDDLEIHRGWRVDPDGTDTATGGRWQRGDPAKGYLQLGSAISGASVLVTGRKASQDVDGGRTTTRSPLIVVPDHGKVTLRLRYWVGLSAGAGAGDGLRVHLVDAGGARLATLLEVSGTGSGAKRAPAWKSATAPLPAGLAGQRVAIELEAVDAGPDSYVEAGVDEVRVITG